MAAPTIRKRINKDIIKMIGNNYEVATLKRNSQFSVRFNGPTDTPYETGTWMVRIFVPENYPFRPPKIAFINKIFHPNIDDETGIVCLDVLKDEWTPLFDLTNIFDSFLPQLLTYPNPVDPLNQTAAALCLKNPEEYRKTVLFYVQKYAGFRDKKVKVVLKRKKLVVQEIDEDEDSLSLSSLSDLSEEN